MIKIYGHSDDLFEVDGQFNGEAEYGCYDQAVSLLIEDHNCSVIVTGLYGRVGRAGVWTIAVEPVDEGKPMPPMRLEMAKNLYSPVLIIECSMDTTVSEIGRNGNK